MSFSISSSLSNGTELSVRVRSSIFSELMSGASGWVEGILPAVVSQICNAEGSALL